MLVRLHLLDLWVCSTARCRPTSERWQGSQLKGHQSCSDMLLFLINACITLDHRPSMTRHYMWFRAHSLPSRMPAYRAIIDI
jgi:hypothetical protein